MKIAQNSSKAHLLTTAPRRKFNKSTRINNTSLIVKLTWLNQNFKHNLKYVIGYWAAVGKINISIQLSKTYVTGFSRIYTIDKAVDKASLFNENTELSW